MQPLSRKKRWAYLFGLICVFLILIPIITFYAIGYRFNSFFELIRTGGIFLSGDRSGLQIYVDGEFEKKTGFFQRSFLIPNLKPGLHELVVKKDGFLSWTKTVQVFEEKVTEVYPFVVPEKVVVKKLVQYILPDGSDVLATTTADLKLIKNKILNPEYVLAKELFIATSTKMVVPFPYQAKFATSTKDELLIKDKQAIWREDNFLHVRWLGDKNDIPYYFCLNEICETDILIPTISKTTYFNFYPRREDLVLFSLNDGIYLSEIDNRNSSQNIMPVLKDQGVDFRVSNDGVIYVKKGEVVSKLEL